VLNPVQQLAAVARERGALTIVDAVTSLGGHPLDVGAWGIDNCYSCTRKCLGGSAGMAPVVFGPRALEKRVRCRSFYFDLALLEDYWLSRGPQTSARRVQHRDRRRPRTARRKNLAGRADGRQLFAPPHRLIARDSGERVCQTRPSRSRLGQP